MSNKETNGVHDARQIIFANTPIPKEMKISKKNTATNFSNLFRFVRENQIKKKESIKPGKNLLNINEGDENNLRAFLSLFILFDTLHFQSSFFLVI